MKCLPFMFVCWCSSILPVTICIKVDGYSCVTAFWNSITCVLNITGNPVGLSNTTYSLKFIYEEEKISCPLVETNHSYSCVCKIRKDSHVFSSYDEYDLKLCYESGCQPLTENFQPRQNIELTSPHQPEVQQTPKTFNITWKSGYEDHQYLYDCLDYELLLQTSQSTENKILRSNSLKGYALIQRSILKPSATYCIKVRSIPNSNDYIGTWSKWSPSTCWKNEAAEVDGYSCVTAFWNSITCVLNITGNPVGLSNTTYSLKFIYEEEKISCPLVEMNHSYSCVCKIRKDLHVFSSYDEYDLKLCYESGCQPLTENFQPTQNIELTSPHQPEVQQTPKTFNITWKSGYEDHQYLYDCLDYELLLQTSQSTENKILHSNSLEGYALIQRSILKPSATYCIKVRSIPNSDDYIGTWSKWSPSTCWKNEAAEEQDYTLVILIKSLGPVCVAVGVLLFVFYSPAARLKIKTLSKTPSPAPFFQPLFQQHEGNLQKWLSPQHQFVLTYKTEENLRTDPVIVVPKPITKDPEENQDFHNPPVIQLAFHQCQTSYVGLPGIHEASTPITTVCPGDMPYTQLPCSVWGVGIKEVEVVCTPPEDFFNMSRADSGCSCEDLTQSPECSLPNNPVDDSPPPCYCSDYCILNKTAKGFAPVLMSKRSNLNVPFDSLQECES